jgi:hypothetical protein
MKPIRTNTRWLADIRAELVWILDDVELAAVRATMRGASRKTASRPTWRRASRRLETLRRACLADRPRLAVIRRLAREAEELFQRASDLTRPPPEPAPTATQVSVLDGYFLTGDGADTVFDRCRDPQEHRTRWGSRLGAPRAIQMDAGPSGEIKACRVYPDALMPPGSTNQFGRWRVTVEFWARSHKTRHRIANTGRRR